MDGSRGVVRQRRLAASNGLSTVAILAHLLVPGAAPLVPLSPVTRRSESDADLYLPPHGPSPGIVLVLGAVREGRRYPLLETVARTVAGCGFAVLVPELGRLRQLVLAEDALDDLIKAANALRRQDGVSDSPVGLFGFSLGGSLALLAAADDRLRDRVACVASMGGYFRLADMLAAATVGVTEPGKASTTLAAPSAFAVAASLVDQLPDPDRDRLMRLLDADRDRPIEALADVNLESVGRQARAVLAVLRNRDPAAVASLVQGLDGMAAGMARLSPAGVIRQIAAPVWMVHDQRDRYVPAEQFRLMRQSVADRRNFKFFSIRLLEHTEPVPPMLNPVRLLGDYLPGLVSLARFVHGPLAAVRHAADRP
jgi:dienelactone hydrolase